MSNSKTKLFNIDSELADEFPTPPLTSRELEATQSLRDAFRDNDFELDGEVWVISEGIENAWRIVEVDQYIVRAFEVRRKRKKATVFAFTESTLSDRLWDYPVFEVGLPSTDASGHANRILLCDGRDRIDLDEDQAQRWDYYFRPYEPLVGLAHKLAIFDTQAELEQNENDMKKARLAGYIWLISVVFFFVGIAKFMKVSRLREENEELAEHKRILEEELDSLMSQASTNTLSDDEIDQFYDKCIDNLEKEAIESLGLHPDSILHLDGNVNPRGLKGITIDDWGLIQPDDTPGKKSINSRHLDAVIVGTDCKPRFAVYYVQFIFPTDQQIAVYGCFYDFILGQRFGLLTDEYFYHNVVSVASQSIAEKSLLNPDRMIETTRFRLTVSSGDSIQVAVTDEQVIEDLNLRFLEKHKLREDKRRQIQREQRERTGDAPIEDNHTPSDAAQSAAPKIVVSPESLPITRARSAIAFIRNELRKRANDAGS